MFSPFFSPPVLPRECGCGDTHSDTCTQIGLRNHHDFPPFVYLQDENDIDESYYEQVDGCIYSPIRHWALVGEIVNVSYFVRPRVTIQTQYGEEVLVNFHLDEPRPSFFNWEDLKPKSTLIILYAQSRTFLDMNRGIRQESADSAMVFPVSFKDLADEFQCYSILEKNDTKTCFSCNAQETENNSLMKCARCKKAFYCNKECQVLHWKRSHKRLCKHANMLTNLASLNMSRFEGFVTWSFPDVTPLTVDERRKGIEREMLYHMGAIDESFPNRFDQLLSYIRDKDCAPHLPMNIYEDSSTIVGDSFLFQSFQGFLSEISNNTKIRNYVVDLDFDFMNTTNVISESILLLLPLWQHENCIGGISWSIQSDQFPLAVINSGIYDNNSVWFKKQYGLDTFLIKNHITQTVCFVSDYIASAAEMGVELAKKNPRHIIIRVLHVRPTQESEKIIHSIATKNSAPTNVFTIWIRESNLCGVFHPPNSSLSLVDQLLDFASRLPFSNEIEEMFCFACQSFQNSDKFSESQLSKYRDVARCKNCVASDKW